MSRELPHLAHPPGTHCLTHATLGREPGVHEAIGTIIGHGRSYPGEIIDDEFLLLVFSLKNKLGSWKAAGEYIKSQMTREQRIEARAVLLNLSRMRRENEGRLPWEE